MRFAPDPIAELRAFFAHSQAKTQTIRLSPMCECNFCLARRIKLEEHDEPRKPLGVGIFGIRPPTKPNRYWELKYLRIDSLGGRGPGGHFAPTIKPMPKPNFLESIRELRIVREIDALVEKARIPALKLGNAADYRKELSAEACAELYAVREITCKQAVDRAERRLTKLYRELT